MIEESFSKPTRWRSIWFDSVLEADWAASFTVWGVDWLFHPGSLRLSNGELYEPDFLLRNAGEFGADILFEAKGDHNERVHKPWLAQEDNPDLLVMVGRSPWLRADDSSSYPAAVWEPKISWDLNGRGVEYVSGELASAQHPGLRFYKGLANSSKIR